jgi:hypothetical protein
VQAGVNALSILRSLMGQEISTVTGRRNRILRLDGDDLIVATERSPDRTAVPIQMIQSGLYRLQESGELEISVASLSYRSSFAGAVLLTLPGNHLSRTSPPRNLLADPATQYKLNQAGSINALWSAAPRQCFWLEIIWRPHRSATVAEPSSQSRSQDGGRPLTAPESTDYCAPDLGERTCGEGPGVPVGSSEPLCQSGQSNAYLKLPQDQPRLRPWREDIRAAGKNGSTAAGSVNHPQIPGRVAVEMLIVNAEKLN